MATNDNGKEFDDLFTRYGSDKGIWGYSPAYEEHLGPQRYSARNVLEIGICGYRDIPNNVVGASLFAWRDYFPHAHVYGLDNDGKFIFNDQHRITTALCDAYDHSQLQSALRFFGHKLGTYDFICDDAVHDPEPQFKLINMLWPHLTVGGVYAIEEACPYKQAGNDLEPFIKALIGAMPDMRVHEFQTHKDERLLLCRKDPDLQ
jgi:hypothetical protein